MEILTLEQKRALGFVDACNRSGHRPTEDAVIAWLTSPQPDRPAAAYALKMSLLLSRGMFAPGPGVRESRIGHLQRLGWLTPEPLQVTPLGSALLMSAENAEPANQAPSVIALDAMIRWPTRGSSAFWRRCMAQFLLIPI